MCAGGCPPGWRFLDPAFEFSMNLGLQNLHSVLPPGRDAAVCPWLEVVEGEGLTGLAVSQSGFQISISKPGALTSPGNLLERQILRSYPRKTEPQTQGWGVDIYAWTHTPGDSDAPSGLRIAVCL